MARWRWRSQDADLAARFALLIAGIAALTAARAVSFIASEPDRSEPPFPPLLWAFHAADMLFLPAANRLPGVTPILYIQCAALALALLCFYMAARARVPRPLLRFPRSLTVGALALTALLVPLTVQGTLPYRLVAGTAEHYGNDAIAATDCAVHLLLEGRNPYASFRSAPCLKRALRERAAVKSTPLRACAFRAVRLYPSARELAAQFERVRARDHPCEFESYYSYPAIAILAPAIPAALGLSDESLFFSGCYLVVAIAVLWRARRGARPVALAAVLANAALWPTAIDGPTDSLYTLFLLLAWSLRDRRWPSALALGLAVATRQPAWFHALFYLLLIGRTMGRREAAIRFGIVAGIFVLADAPFAIGAPGPWLAGVLGPMRDAMFPRGTGLIALSIGGAGSLPLAPRGLYTGLEAVALLLCLALYWPTCRTDPDTGLVLAPVALFFAWRSLYSYFLPLSLLALYPALVGRGGMDPIVRREYDREAEEEERER